MVTLIGLATEMAERYDLTIDAAKGAVVTYAGQLGDADLYDETTDHLTASGAGVVREAFVADYSTPTARYDLVDHLVGLRNITTAVTEAQDQMDTALGERDGRIRQALAAGVPVHAITEVTGLHRQRIYQIRDGR